jgi:hypothetical protein
MSVNRNDRQAGVTRRANNPIQSYGIKPQLVAAPNQIAFWRYLNHLAREKNFSAEQAFG